MATLATATTRPPAPALTKWLAPLASAGLLYLCFFPVAWGWLAWVAMVPVLCLVRLPGEPRWIKTAAYLGGLAFCLPAFQWFRVADARMYFTWLALAFYIAVYWPLTVAVNWIVMFVDAPAAKLVTGDDVSRKLFVKP